MKSLLTIVQIVISLLLLGVILLQNRGQGLSSSFGGGGEFYRSKRGIEKILFRATIAIVFLFLITSLANLIVK